MSEKLKGSELSFSRVSILHIDLSRQSFYQSTWILQNDKTIGTILGFVHEDISLPGKVNSSKNRDLDIHLSLDSKIKDMSKSYMISYPLINKPKHLGVGSDMYLCSSINVPNSNPES